MSQYGDEDAGPADVLDTSTRTARKPHKCNACGESITPGRKYTRVAILFDGRWDVTVRCERCQLIYEHLSKRIAKSGEPEEYCDESLHCGHEYTERWSEPPPEEIAALAFWRPGDPLPKVSP